MERLWNYNDKGKGKYCERNLFQCHFVHHKSRIDRRLIRARETEQPGEKTYSSVTFLTANPTKTGL
jgi:hypothetical protein